MKYLPLMLLGVFTVPSLVLAQNTFPSSGNVGIGVTTPLSTLDVFGNVFISPLGTYKGDASLQIQAPQGCCGRMTQIEAATPNTDALNIMSSQDASNNAHWFAWGVQQGQWRITPSLDFNPSSGLTISATGQVGVGTISPGVPLEVNGSIKLSNGSAGNLIFQDGSVQTTAYVPGNGGTSGYSAITQSSGNDIGIGTTSPNALLQVGAGPGSGNGNMLIVDGSFAGGNLVSLNNATPGGEASIVFSSVGQTGWVTGNGAWGNTGMFVIGSYQAGPVLAIQPGGNLGIGTNSPSSRLEVNGNLKLTANSGASLTFADNTVQSTAWTGTTCGGDYAESVDVTGDRSTFEPGDALVADANSPGRFLKSIEPYSTLVAGIYSTKPGVIGRRQPNPAAGASEVPMAMVGIVPAKASTENGSIKIGDLLVTSSRPGYVMKGTDRALMLGAVVGKALGPLDAGLGIVEVLVTLE